MAERLVLPLEDLFYILTGDKQVCWDDEDRTSMQNVFQSTFEKMLDTGILPRAVMERLKETEAPILAQKIIETNTIMLKDLDEQLRELISRIRNISFRIEDYKKQIEVIEGSKYNRTLPTHGPHLGAKHFLENHIKECNKEIELYNSHIEKAQEELNCYLKVEIKHCEAEIEQCKAEIKRCEVILAK